MNLEDASDAALKGCLAGDRSSSGGARGAGATGTTLLPACLLLRCASVLLLLVSMLRRHLCRHFRAPGGVFAGHGCVCG